MFLKIFVNENGSVQKILSPFFPDKRNAKVKKKTNEWRP